MNNQTFSHHLPWLHKNIHIAVIGDVILDEYLIGDVERISPEAPVPVHLVKEVQWVLGGAANVALNIQRCGGHASLFGMIGEDESGQAVLKLLDKEGIQRQGLITALDRPTIKKTRIMSSSQHMMRIDWEKKHPIGQKDQDRLLEALIKVSPDAYLISDYGKGSLPKNLIQRIIALAKEKQKPVIVDPKGVDYRPYQGCTLMTPNKKEASLALGLVGSEGVSGEELGRRLQSVYQLDHILVTMGAQGMVYIPKKDQDPCVFRGTKARQVFDVSGAGDTVVALMALGLAAKLSMTQSMDWANKAAGLVVEKLGTQPISWQELLSDHHEQKCVSLEDLDKILDRKKRVVFTNGCFDIFHAGHARYLKEAKKLGDLLIVGVNSDESIKALKGETRPINPLGYRIEVLSALECIDFIVVFSDLTPLQLINCIKPHVLVKGNDYKPEDIVGFKEIQEWGGRVETISLVPFVSSTILLEKLGF